MANPTVSASFNKSSYAPGEQITLTVNYADADTKVLTVTTTVTDASGATGSTTSVVNIVDQVAVAVSSSPAKTWTKVSDNGSVAVFTTTA